MTFVLINNWGLNITEDELVDLVLGVASGAVSKSILTQAFAERCRRLD